MKHSSYLLIENSFSIKSYLKQTKQLIMLMFPHYVIIFFKHQSMLSTNLMGFRIILGEGENFWLWILVTFLFL